MTAAEKDEFFQSNSAYAAARENEKSVAAKWGIGSPHSQGLNAITTALTAILDGQTDLQAASNTLAPYIANLIGTTYGHGEDNNTAAQLTAHAILGGALAYINGGNAASALSDAKDAYSQAQRDYASGKITKDALNDSKANVAMATANLASAQIAVGASAAAAAASTATYGFTIGANGERIETTNTTQTEQGQWQGSHLDLNNLTLKSEGQDVNVQGSRLTATGTTTFDGTKDFNVTAGTEHAKQESNSKTNSQSVSYTYGGGGSASIGKQTSESKSESLNYVNSEINLNKTAGSLDTLNIQGGEVVIADRGSLKVKEIVVESLQDTASASNSSKGGSIGAGFGSNGQASNISASYNQGKGSSDSAWVNNTSKLLIGNAQNDADLDAMGVEKVSNIGGVIANATKNADGTLTDHSKLNYSGELELKDIKDHDYNSSSGFNVSTTLGKTTQDKDGEKSKYPNGSTTLGLNSSGQETEQVTKATMGQGMVKNTTDTSSRDVNNTQEITRDQTTGMLDGSVTIDHRLLSENGRDEIIQEQKDLKESAKNFENLISDSYLIFKDVSNGIGVVKAIEYEQNQLNQEERAIFDQVLSEYINNNKSKDTDSWVPVVVGAGEEALALATTASITCARTVACLNAIRNLAAVVGVEILSAEDRRKEVAPTPIPSTSENSATGGPAGGGQDPENENKEVDQNAGFGKQSKKMNDNQIADLVGNPRWHQTNLKSRIVKAYSKELRGSKNFDFYKDAKTGDVYIKGNQSKEMIRINLERFL